MADWQQLIQSIVLGFIFSFLLAKLFSIIFSFREENLRIVRRDSFDGRESKPSESEVKPVSDDLAAPATDSAAGVLAEERSVSEKSSVGGESSAFGGGSGGGDDSDDDWEGVESTELDEAFSAATAFVAATAADRSSAKVSTDVQLQLYGLYKIATEGPCSAPQPSALKMTARAKWQAWQKLGPMPPEEAMLKYITIVTELYPSWTSGSTNLSKRGDSSDASNMESKGPMGPVFSSFIYEEDAGNDLKLDAIHAFAREGDVEGLQKCIESSVSVNQKDSEGRTPLHWAVDRGHLNVTELLVGEKADVNAKDSDGQTPLHYAAVCEREAIAEFLVKQNADTDIKDNDGNSPFDLCDSNWPWMKLATH